MAQLGSGKGALQSERPDTPNATQAELDAVNSRVTVIRGAPINVKDETYGAVGDGVADDYAAIQAACDVGGVVFIPEGTYLLSAPLVLDEPGTFLQGMGANETTILQATHSDGPVLQLTHYYQGFDNITIAASAGRTAGSAGSGATANVGVLHDDGLDTTTQQVRQCRLTRFKIRAQPSHGMILCGSFLALTAENFRITDNGGHGIVVDDGTLIGRSNTVRPGGARFENGSINDNDGHAVVVGGGAVDVAYGDSPGYRLEFRNLDTAGNLATPASALYADHTWFVYAESSTISLCGLGGGDSYTPVAVAGSDMHLINNRYIDSVSPAVTVCGFEATGQTLTTRGVVIDGMLIGSAASALNPAVDVDDSAGVVEGLVVRSKNTRDITTLLSHSNAVAYESDLAGATTATKKHNRTKIVASALQAEEDPVTLSDDEACHLNFTGAVNGCTVVITPNVAARGAAIISFRTGASAFCQTVGSVGATVTTGTGALTTGTGDGTDGNLNVFADTATNRLYIKNRTGGSGVYIITVLGTQGGGVYSSTTEI